jgi:hypothetical protein
MGSEEMGSGEQTPGRGSPEDSRREAELQEDLLGLVEAVNRAAVGIRVAEAEHAFLITVLARASAGRHTQHGLTATEACARALGVARSTLQAFASLAARWRPVGARESSAGDRVWREENTMSPHGGSRVADTAHRRRRIVARADGGRPESTTS